MNTNIVEIKTDLHGTSITGTVIDPSSNSPSREFTSKAALLDENAGKSVWFVYQKNDSHDNPLVGGCRYIITEKENTGSYTSEFIDWAVKRRMVSQGVEISKTQYLSIKKWVENNPSADGKILFDNKIIKDDRDFLIKNTKGLLQREGKKLLVSRNKDNVSTAYMKFSSIHF